MDLDGRIIIGIISLIWLVGFSSLLIDCFVKRPQIVIQKPKKSNYASSFDDDADFLLSSDLEDSNIHNDTYSSSIFDSNSLS